MEISYYVIPGIKSEKVSEIIEEVCTRYGVTLQNLKEQNRSVEVVFARHLLMYALKKKAKLSHSAITKICERDRSTIISAIHSMENYISTNSARKNEILQIINRGVGNSISDK